MNNIKLEDFLKLIKPRKPRKDGKVDIIVNTSKIGNTVEITVSPDELEYSKWFPEAGGGDLGVTISKKTNKMIGARIELPKNWSGKIRTYKS